MVLTVGGAVRAAGVLLFAVVALWLFGWEGGPRDAVMAVRPVLLVAVVPAVWARLDRRLLGAVAAEWVWARAAAFVAVVAATAGVLQGWPIIIDALLAVIAGAIVAVPAWAAIAGIGRVDVSQQSVSRPVSRAAMTLVATGGVAALLAAPVAALLFTAYIQWTGCFLACQEPNRAAGLALAVIAAVLIGDVIAWGVAAWRRFPRVLTNVAAVPVIVAAVLAFLVS
ncbi:hypothetical protein GCM10011492_00890 [Flexivirga endophytica]|uniref:Uncharacterized protein n=1 Tax=Flexivirga endophytica TaxID=1849103 RepID=A0A916WMM0_9MICO|nr:hypothetical protein [Flexivirga endophytica]GGB15039.1 hypothetical protein GCM10011492_00890 [Flexivirga endophytica]GHB65213.1 hypothetical protein GCM10008112_37600 [Flexivirga endophytica]